MIPENIVTHITKINKVLITKIMILVDGEVTRIGMGISNI